MCSIYINIFIVCFAIMANAIQNVSAQTAQYTLADIGDYHVSTFFDR